MSFFHFSFYLFEHCWREPENKHAIAYNCFTVIVGHMTNLKLKLISCFYDCTSSTSSTSSSLLQFGFLVHSISVILVHMAKQHYIIVHFTFQSLQEISLPPPIFSPHLSPSRPWCMRNRQSTRWRRRRTAWTSCPSEAWSSWGRWSTAAGTEARPATTSACYTHQLQTHRATYSVKTEIDELDEEGGRIKRQMIMSIIL